MTTIEGLPDIDVRQIVIRGPAIQHKTLSDKTTKVLLRNDTESRVTIDVFFPHGAHTYRVNYSAGHETCIRPRRLLRVLRITVTGQVVDHIMHMIQTGELQPDIWDADAVVKMFVPILKHIQFTR